MVDRFERLRRSTGNNSVSRSGVVRVVMDVPVEVTNYGEDDVTDEDVQNRAIEAIQEGKGRVIKFD